MLTRRFPMLRPGSRVVAVAPGSGGADVTADLRAAAQVCLRWQRAVGRGGARCGGSQRMSGMI